eukprot:760334-Hanusia_phi.AAC.6
MERGSQGGMVKKGGWCAAAYDGKGHRSYKALRIKFSNSPTQDGPSTVRAPGPGPGRSGCPGGVTVDEVNIMLILLLFG